MLLGIFFTVLQILDRLEIGMTDSPTMLTSLLIGFQVFLYISGFVAYIWNGAAHNTLHVTMSSSSNHNSSSTPHHVRIHTVYRDRGVCPEQVDWQDPEELTVVAKDFMTAVRKAAGLPDGDQRDISLSDESLHYLLRILEFAYDKETTFDMSLFLMLRYCLREYIIEQDDPNCIILGNESSMENDAYAIGFVRQKCVALGICCCNEQSETRIRVTAVPLIANV
jgi:hypothetical protein